jgi:hypothetical protein
MNVMHAAQNVAEDYEGGASALARAIDKKEFTFLHELQETGSAKLGLMTAVKMTRRTKDLRILHAFAAEFHQICMPLPQSLEEGTDECMLALGGVVRESSDVCQELCTSLGTDGVINDNELARISREAGELVAAVHKLVRAATARNQLNKRSDGERLA